MQHHERPPGFSRTTERYSRRGVARPTHVPLHKEACANLGIDLSVDDSRVAVLDEDGEVVEEARAQDASLEKIAQEYAGSEAVIEATSNYYTIYGMLDEYLITKPEIALFQGSSAPLNPGTAENRLQGSVSHHNALNTV